jgi:hypothetical protein
MPSHPFRLGKVLFDVKTWDSSCFIEIIVLNSIIKGGVGRVRVPSECFRGMERGQE